MIVLNEVNSAFCPHNFQFYTSSGVPSESSREQIEAGPVTSHVPATPSTSCHVTQSSRGTPVNTSRSPLDFNRHMQYIRQVSKSPGEGFTYTGRSMYGKNDNSQVKYIISTVFVICHFKDTLYYTWKPGTRILKSFLIFLTH